MFESFMNLKDSDTIEIYDSHSSSQLVKALFDELLYIVSQNVKALFEALTDRQILPTNDKSLIFKLLQITMRRN